MRNAGAYFLARSRSDRAPSRPLGGRHTSVVVVKPPVSPAIQQKPETRPVKDSATPEEARAAFAALFKKSD